MKKATIKKFASYLIASTLAFDVAAEALVKGYYVDLSVQFIGGNIDAKNPQFEVTNVNGTYELGNCIQNPGSKPNSLITICNPVDNKGKNVPPLFTSNQPISSTLISSTSSYIKCGEADLFNPKTKALRFYVTYDSSGKASCQAVVESVKK